MKRIAVTQRVADIPEYGERRDALDQRWIAYLLACDLFPVIVSNHLAYVQRLVEVERLDGILLTGGNSLAKYGGSAQERDEVERFLVTWALRNDVPILGVCRGMQVLQDYYGVRLEPVSGHVAQRHRLNVTGECEVATVLSQYVDVNSYHDFGARGSVNPLTIVARSEDQVVMAVKHTAKNVYGVMWHSEREHPFVDTDLKLFRTMFES